MLEPGSWSLGLLLEEVFAGSQQGIKLAGANPFPMGQTGKLSWRPAGEEQGSGIH